MSLRRKIYEAIEAADKDDRDSLICDRVMLVGIAAAAQPAGIITAGCMRELSREKRD